jgi:hypothetical protein
MSVTSQQKIYAKHANIMVGNVNHLYKGEICPCFLFAMYKSMTVHWCMKNKEAPELVKIFVRKSKGMVLLCSLHIVLGFRSF